MRKGWRLLWVLLLLLGALAMPACAEEADEEGAFPELNEQGFLDEGEFVYENLEDGLWRYCSQTLKIEIRRYQQTTGSRQVWYEAEVWAGEGEAFRLIPYNEEKRMKSSNYPYKVARKNQTVLAINTDYAHWRINNGKRVGIIIRDGEVYSEKTWEKGANKFPNLDVLALYSDGNMEVYDCDEHTAQEYLDMGVTSTLAFGPVLIRDGELNQWALDKYGKSKAPRTAIGMVEKGHYWCMMLEGRSTKSKGAGITFLAEKMMDRGCTLAFNLDGGDTSCMIFMGQQITCIKNNAAGRVSARSTAEILGIGVSEQVPEFKK